MEEFIALRLITLCKVLKQFCCVLLDAQQHHQALTMPIWMTVGGMVATSEPILQTTFAYVNCRREKFPRSLYEHVLWLVFDILLSLFLIRFKNMISKISLAFTVLIDQSQNLFIYLSQP